MAPYTNKSREIINFALSSVRNANNNNFVGRCNFCIYPQSIGFNKSTSSNIFRHMRRRHPKELEFFEARRHDTTDHEFDDAIVHHLEADTNSNLPNFSMNKSIVKVQPESKQTNLDNMADVQEVVTICDGIVCEIDDCYPSQLYQPNSNKGSQSKSAVDTMIERTRGPSSILSSEKSSNLKVDTGAEITQHLEWIYPKRSYTRKTVLSAKTKRCNLSGKKDFAKKQKVKLSKKELLGQRKKQRVCLTEKHVEPLRSHSSSSKSGQDALDFIAWCRQIKRDIHDQRASGNESPISPRGVEDSSLLQFQDPKIEIDTSQYSAADETSTPGPSLAQSAIASSGGTSELSGLCLVKREVHCYSVLDQLMKDQTYTDVTITADGHTFYAHKIVLCVASSYFRRVLSDNSPGVRNVVVLRDISHTEMRNLLQFLYTGEATVEASDLPSFMRTAQMLEINSLSDGCLAPSLTPASASAASTASGLGTTTPYVPHAPQALNARSNLVPPQFTYSGQAPTSAASTLPFGLVSNAMRPQQSNALLEKPRQTLHLQQQQQQQLLQHHSPAFVSSPQEHASSLIVPSRSEMLQIPKIDKIYSEKTRKPGRRRKQPVVTESKFHVLPQAKNAQKQQPEQSCATQQSLNKQENQTGVDPRIVELTIPQPIDQVVPEILAKALLRTPDLCLHKSRLEITQSSDKSIGDHLAGDITCTGGLERLPNEPCRPQSPPSKSPILCNGEQFKIKIRSVDSMTASEFDAAASTSSIDDFTGNLVVSQSSISIALKHLEGDDLLENSTNLDCVPSTSKLENDLVLPPREIEDKGLRTAATDDLGGYRLASQKDDVISMDDANNTDCMASSQDRPSTEQPSLSGGLSSLAEQYHEDAPNKRRKISDDDE